MVGRLLKNIYLYCWMLLLKGHFVSGGQDFIFKVVNDYDYKMDMRSFDGMPELLVGSSRWDGPGGNKKAYAPQ